MLLLLVRALQLIKSGLKLVLDLVQVSNLVFSNLEVLLGLGSILADVLLLLVQLVDDLILVGNLIIQALDGNHDVINVLLDCNNFLFKDLLVLHSILTGSLSLGKFILSLNKVLLKSSNVSSGLGLFVMIDGQVTLLLLKLSHQSLLLFLDSFILFQESGLGLELFIILTPDGVGLFLKNSKFLLRVGHANKRSGLLDDDKPSPFSHGQVLSEVSLSNLDQLSLISLLLINSVLALL